MKTHRSSEVYVRRWTSVNKECGSHNQEMPPNLLPALQRARRTRFEHPVAAIKTQTFEK